MVANFEKQIKKFFDRIEKNSALVFTTFGLDEIVLVQLLRQHKISPQRRIVVFHEIMKHRNPGFLRTHYPNSKVVSVELSRRKSDEYCPIFHSKIWAQISRSTNRCKRLAIHSINLTRFHLDNKKKTLESFHLVDGLDISLPKYQFFGKGMILTGNGNSRMKVKPSTFFLRSDSGKFRFIAQAEPVGKLIGKAFKELNEICVGCAAPFINKRTVKLLQKGNNPLGIWVGPGKNGTSLHAKIIETNKYLLIGSPNLTVQAFGLDYDRPINHETIYLIKRPKGFHLRRALKGFRRENLDTLDDEDCEFLEDQDVINADARDWNQLKNWAANGPEEVILVLNERTRKAEIHIKGGLKRINKVILAYISGGGSAESFIKLPPGRKIRISKDKQRYLIEAVLSPCIWVKGMMGRKKIWAQELNLGDFWRWKEANSGRLSILRKGEDGKLFDHDGNNKKRGWVFYNDVRDQRSEAYFNERLSTKEQKWNDWLRKYGGRQIGMPVWCIQFGKELRRQKNA
jgi:hypothetical protein